MKMSRCITALGTISICLLCLIPAHAQVATTGPAALARQMPTIYGPYLANISRVRILQQRGKLRSARSSTAKRPVGT
jgi:hypothetical protein